MIPKISGFLSLATLLIVSAAVAAEPYLVKDLWPGTRPVSANPSFVANVGTSTYFSVLEPSRNLRLWKTDGTDAGTVQVPTLGFFSGQGMPFGSSFLAVALDGLNSGSRQLWKTDGTVAGTTMLTSTSGVILGAVAPDFSAAFYFVQSSRPTEVWRTDGTASGNVKLGTIPGTFGIGIAATTSSIVFISGNRIRAIDTSGNLQVLSADATLMNLSERAGSTTVFEVWSGTSV
jgi:hypothetical protein